MRLNIIKSSNLYVIFRIHFRDKIQIFIIIAGVFEMVKRINYVFKYYINIKYLNYEIFLTPIVKQIADIIICITDIIKYIFFI